MQLIVEPFSAPRKYQPGLLQQMYDSPELFNEGVASFHYPLLVASDEELEQFLGKIFHDVSHTVSDVAKGVGKVVSTIDKVVPVSLLTSTLAAPLKAGIGAVQAAAEGKNVFQGAIRSLVPDIGTRFLVDTAAGVAGGKNILKAAEAGMKAGIGDVKKSLQFAAMVAPFVPGIGTGVGAALGAANALANGEPITEALISAARSAVPGGQIAQMAFDVGAKLVQGKKLGDALLEEARAKLPGGPLAKAAFDVGLSIVQGKNIQAAALKATGQLLPKSPFAESAMNFVQKVASGQNLQQAALSTVGNMVFKKVQQQAGSLPLPGLNAILPQVDSARRALPAGAAALRTFQAGHALARSKAISQTAQLRPGVNGRLLPSPFGKPSPAKVPWAAGMPAKLPPLGAALNMAPAIFSGIGGELGSPVVASGASFPAPAPPAAFARPALAAATAALNPLSAGGLSYGGEFPASGKWHKRNGTLLVAGVYA
jgi:hypothetical protein